MSFKTIAAAAFGMAALAQSAALPQSSYSSFPYPKDKEFALALKAEGYPFLNAELSISDSTTAVKVITFQRPSAYPGTPAYLNDTELLFDTGAAQPLAMTFEEVGDNYGYKTPVLAVPGSDAGRKGFTIANQTLYPELHAALESFFACNTTILGQPQLQLFWGVFNSNGSAPYGCIGAQLVQDFDVQGGAPPPTGPAPPPSA